MGAPGDIAVTVEVTRVVPAARDEFGDPVGVASPPHTIEGCLLAPGGSAESQNRGDVVASDWDLYAPEGADIIATDRVRVAAVGVTAEVHGDPKWWPGGGVVVALRRVTGS